MVMVIFVAVQGNSGHKSRATSNMDSRAVLLPSLVDTTSSQEVKLRQLRWFRRRSDDANSIRTMVAIIGL